MREEHHKRVRLATAIEHLRSVTRDMRLTPEAHGRLEWALTDLQEHLYAIGHFGAECEFCNEPFVPPVNAIRDGDPSALIACNTCRAQAVPGHG